MKEFNREKCVVLACVSLQLIQRNESKEVSNLNHYLEEQVSKSQTVRKSQSIVNEWVSWSIWYS